MSALFFGFCLYRRCIIMYRRCMQRLYGILEMNNRISYFFPLKQQNMSEERYKDLYRVKSARLPGWDYRNEGGYFVTICTKNMECFFGDVVNGKVILSEIGLLAHKFWNNIPVHFPFVILDAFIIMPNHIHGILILDSTVETFHEPAETLHNPVQTLHATSLPEDNSKQINKKMSQISPVYGSLSTIIRSYKSAVSKESRLINSDFNWLPRFYDRIIRNTKEYNNIKNYIFENPDRWMLKKHCIAQ